MSPCNHSGIGARIVVHGKAVTSFNDFDDFGRRARCPIANKEGWTGFEPDIVPEYLLQSEDLPLRYQEGGEMDMAGEPNDKELIADAVEAIKGIDPNPQALAKFVARYGEDALRDLVKKVNDGEFDTNKGVSGGS